MTKSNQTAGEFFVALICKVCISVSCEMWLSIMSVTSCKGDTCTHHCPLLSTLASQRYLEIHFLRYRKSIHMNNPTIFVLYLVFCLIKASPSLLYWHSDASHDLFNWQIGPTPPVAIWLSTNIWIELELSGVMSLWSQAFV